jgi:cytochrome c556
METLMSNALNTARRLATAIVAAGTLLTLTWAMPAFADDSENPAAQYRHEVMETLGANTSALVKVLTGKVEAPGHLQIHADTLAQTAKLIADLFTAGSEGGHALPLAFSETDKVAAAAQTTADATAALASAVANGERPAIMKAFREVGDSCKGCHERYKEDDD